MRSKSSAAVDILSCLFAILVTGQAQDKGSAETIVCRHGQSSGGTPWNAESARRNYRSYVRETGRALARAESGRPEKISVGAQRFEGCARDRTRTRKLSARLPGEIVFASTRDAKALKGRLGAQSMVVFVDYERIEDVLEAARELGCSRWSFGSKEAAEALGVTCVPSIVKPEKSGGLRIDEINLR